MGLDSHRLTLVPLSTDLDVAVELGRQAAVALSAGWDPPQDAKPLIDETVGSIQSGTAVGRLFARGGALHGIALWEPETSLHLVVRSLFLATGHQSVEDYRAAIEAMGSVGAVHLLPAPLAGLPPSEEQELMGALRFARFGRTDMRLPASVATPTPPETPGTRIRVARADDEPNFVAMMSVAFREHFDRYLFQSLPDYEADTARAVREILGGHYGEFLPWASAIAEQGDHAVGAILVVRAVSGCLIINVSVAPAAQRRGIGRALVVASVRALRERGEAPLLLNVTEGNSSALRLYSGLGFVRNVTGWAWYSLDTVPVGPDGRRTTPPPPGSAPSP